MDATYVSWIWHGKEATLNNSTDDNDQLREEEHKFVDEDPINMDIVYMLDPLGPHLRSDDWKHVVDMAMKMFHAVGNRKKGRSKTSWEIVKAPRQPDSNQCGFYVMAYKRTLIEHMPDIDDK
nr:uncharacterized protein LOC109184124 [Ipomoea trifida]